MPRLVPLSNVHYISSRHVWLLYLRPVCSQRVHIHRVEKASKALVKRGERIAEVLKAFHVRRQRVRLVEQLGHGRLEEAETVGGICEGVRVGKREKGALGDAAERCAMGCRSGRHWGDRSKKKPEVW